MPGQPLRQLLENPPNLHGATTYSLVRGALEWIYDFPGPLRTLETGCGLSTLVFILRGDEHVCITPDAEEPDGVRQYCDDQGLDGSRVTFHIARSELVLPKLDVNLLDFVLIDGSHAFPHVFIDYFYSARFLRVGGTMVIDDTHLWTGKVLRDFLRSEPEWATVKEWDGRTVAFRKVAELQPRDWFDQPYVFNRSTLARARARMAWSMLKQGDMTALLRYAGGTLRRSRADD